MSEPSILIVGLGAIGGRHLSNCHQLGVSRIGAVDVSWERREEVRRTDPAVVVYDAVNVAVADGYDAMVICVPTYLHMDIAQMAVEARMHLLIEKPISHEVFGVVELLEEAERRKLIVMVGYMYRFWPALQAVHKLLADQTIGKVYSVQATFSQYLPHWPHWEDYRDSFVAKREQGGGVLLEESHILDMVRWLFGDIAGVFCVNGRVSHLEMTADDLAEMVIMFENGPVGSLHLDLFGREHRKQMVIIGQHGNISWDFHANEVRLYLAEDNVAADKRTWHMQRFPFDRNEMYYREVLHFIECIKGDTRPIVSGYEALKTLEVVAAARRSAESGQYVCVEDRQGRANDGTTSGIP